VSSAEPEVVGNGDEGFEEELPRMTLLDHLDELRRRILYSIIAIFVAFLGSWYFAPEIFHWLEQPFLAAVPEGEKLAFTDLPGPFMLYIKVALLTAIFVSSPVLLIQLWMFLRPGLYKRERRKQVVTISTYFSMMSKILLGLGMVFEMPMLIFFLARMGIVSAGQLLRWFRWAVLLIFVVAAIITPTPDVATQTVFAVPMILLYLLGVLVAAIFGTKRDADD
jgi:sec-independent protein translocase protein TatC